MPLNQGVLALATPQTALESCESPSSDLIFGFWIIFKAQSCSIILEGRRPIDLPRFEEPQIRFVEVVVGGLFFAVFLVSLDADLGSAILDGGNIRPGDDSCTVLLPKNEKKRLDFIIFVDFAV